MIAIGIVLYFNNDDVILGPHAPIQNFEFSEFSFDNVTNVLTVNATLKVIDLNEANPKYHRMYYEVEGPYLFNKVKINSIERIEGRPVLTPIAFINLTAPIELVANEPSTIRVNLDRSLTSGNYSAEFKLPNGSTYSPHFTVP